MVPGRFVTGGHRRHHLPAEKLSWTPTGAWRGRSGSFSGRSTVGLLHGSLCGEKHRRGGHRFRVRSAACLCHRCSPISCRRFGTGKIPYEKLVQLIRKNFDMTPKAVMQTLDLSIPCPRKRRPTVASAARHLGADRQGGGTRDVTVLWTGPGCIRKARAATGPCEIQLKQGGLYMLRDFWLCFP